MTKYNISVPEEIQEKNSVFSFCFSVLKELIYEDKNLKGKLYPLGNSNLISEYNLVKEINEKYGVQWGIGDLQKKMRDFKRQTEINLTPIKNYSKVSKSKVYLEEDLKEFRVFLKNTLNS